MNYQYPGDSSSELEKPILDAIENIWYDPTTKFIVKERTSEFYLLDSAS